MRAAGNPHRPRAPVRRTQFAAVLDGGGVDRDIELQVADDVGTVPIGADGDESFGIFRALRRHLRIVRQDAAEQSAETSIARHRLQRKAGARQHDGDAAPPALIEQVRPQFRFHDDDQARLNSSDESAHGAWRVIGYVAHHARAAEKRLCALAPSGRCRRQDHRHLRIAGAQRANQRRCRGYLAERHGVHPDRRLGTQCGSKTEPFAQAHPISAVAQAPPQHDRQCDRTEKIDQRTVEVAHGSLL